VIPVTEFIENYVKLQNIYSYGPVISFSYQRLKGNGSIHHFAERVLVLEFKFELHINLNEKRESNASQMDSKDFTNVIKVDTHIHLAAGMLSF
jgi:hypothetical protein